MLIEEPAPGEPLVTRLCLLGYIRTPPSGSAIAEAAKFIKFATKGRWSNPKRLFAADMWENAKPSHIVGPKPGWMTFDDVYVDEIRRALKACQVFVW